MKLFIGNLGTEIASHDLLSLFLTYGDVAAAVVAKGNDGSSLGYGYVSMKNTEEAKKAIRGLDKKKFMHQYLVVNEATYSEKPVVGLFKNNN